MVNARQKAKPAGLLHVTRRQEQILDLAASDLPDKQIAEQLGLSLATVRTQWQRFFTANGLHSRTGAVGLWLRRQRR
jgi:DNA-binding NarL/FixJ family response regulator